MAMVQNYQPPKMDGFPTKHDHFYGSFGTIILSHCHMKPISFPVQAHVVLVAAQLVGGMAQDAWGLRHERLQEGTVAA